MITATPESVGIPSKAISAFLKDLSDSRFNMHSVLILRHGKLVTEAYREPYDQDRKHRMFSISKTFTALAAGLLIDEGKLSLTDKIVSFFPEYCPEPINPLLASATVYDMLTMQDPHDHTTHGFGIKENWLESWFITPPDHPPGTVFQYNTTSTNLIASIIERITGQKMMDYMYPRLLTPIGFSEGCTCGETPDGDSFGGSAVFCTPRDLAKLAQFVMDEGIHEGKQLINGDFIRDLRSKQVDNSLMGISVEGMFGYGYFTWHLRNNGFAFFGIHGQFAIGFPDKKLLVVTTGNTTDHYANENDILLSQFLDRLFYNLYPRLSDNPLPNDTEAQAELDSLLILPHMLVQGTVSSPIIVEVAGKTYKMHPNKSGWKTVRFEFSADEGKLCYSNRRGDKEIVFGIGKSIPFQFPEEPDRAANIDLPYDTHTNAAWIDNRTLAVSIYNIAAGYMHLNAVFNNNELTILIRPLTGYRTDYGGYMYGKTLPSDGGNKTEIKYV